MNDTLKKVDCLVNNTEGGYDLLPNTLMDLMSTIGKDFDMVVTGNNEYVIFVEHKDEHLFFDYGDNGHFSTICNGYKPSKDGVANEYVKAVNAALSKL